MKVTKAKPTQVSKVQKTPIKYNIEFTEEQKRVKEGVYKKAITFINGTWGTGKTNCAIQIGLDLIFKKDNNINKMYISRPLDFGSTGFLKGPQPLTSKVMTPFGWKTIGDLQIGELVTTPEGSNSKIVSKSELNREGVYKITTTDGRVMECSRFHLFHTLTYNDKKHRLDKIKFVKNYEGSVKSLDEIISTFLNNKGKLNHYLPYCKPVTFQDTTQKYIKPYVLGVLLGDGSLSDSISFSNIDNELIDRVILECQEMGLNVNKIKNTISYNISSDAANNKPGKEIIITSIADGREFRYVNIGTFLKSGDFDIHRATLGSRCTKNISVDGMVFSFGEKEGYSTNPLKNELYNLNLKGKGALHKFIPKEYIYKASIEDRVDLLRGLMDTDGTNDGKASAFTTISKQLALDVIELVRSLGGRANFYTRNRIGKVTKRPFGGDIITKHISYEVNISLDFNPFYISRKAIRYNPSYKHLIGIRNIELVREDIVQCIKIEDEKGLYITDDYIVTHNTMDEKMSYHIFPLKQSLYASYGKEKIDKMFIDGDIQVFPIDYMKGMTVANAVMIIDEYEDINMADFKLITSRLGKGSKLIFTGDLAQTKLIKDSCIHTVKKSFNTEYVNAHTLTANFREPEAALLLDYLEKEK